MSIFYRDVTFYRVGEVSYHMKKSGFKNLTFMQTLFHDLRIIKDIEPIKEGYGEGSFVIIRGVK